jgi:hypothetical protein
MIFNIMKQVLIFLFLLLTIILSSCNPYRQNGYHQHYVIEAYLVANRSLPPVKVSHTLPFGQTFSVQKVALNNAAVKIQQLDSTGIAKKTYSYYRASAGTYIPKNPEPVLPEHRYKLIVSFPNGDSVTAQTLVPGTFHPVGPIPESAVYEAPQPLAVKVTPSYYPGRQAYFVFTVNAVDTSADQLTPFYADEVTKGNNKIYNYYINSSGIINGKNFTKNPNGTLMIKLPWLAIAFYGENKITANAIDNNLYDFIRTQGAQTGGSSLPPDQIENIEYHVKGGIGIFGSLASDTISVFIKKE